MMTYNIRFEGYWLDTNKGNIPHCGGVYVVYRAVFDALTNRVDLKEIIYIGQAKDINQRINTHDKLNEFISTLNPGEILCYSIARIVNDGDLDLIENALIIAQSPRINQRVESNIDFSDYQFSLSGQCALMKYSNFTVTLNH